MPVPIEMPKLGNTVEECLLARWNKRAGDRVCAGDIVAEIETDKATFEVSAPVDGIVLGTFFEEGELVPVFTNVCVIGEAGEDIEQYRPKPRSGSAEPPPGAPASDKQGVRSQSTTRDGTTLSPRARRFAEAHNFYPAGVRGSGPGGRILEADLRRAYHTPPLTPRAPVRNIETGVPQRVSGLRDRIGRRMRESLAASAQYTLNASADATGLLSLRARIKSSAESIDININEMVMFCAVRALLDMPELNSEFIDGKIHLHSEIHIGFACDTRRGLVVPVIKNAQDLSLEELAARVKQLANQAGDGTIGPDDLAGATFTISNLGALGIETFTPILNPPQVALLGINSIELRPVRRDGRIEFSDRIGLSLTCDHQVIDGAPGARFLKVLAARIASVEAICGLKL